MPEGDTLWRAANALRRHILGQVVVDARPAALGRLAGHRVVAVQPYGKHMYIHFDNGLALHSHLRMTGSWHVEAGGRRRTDRRLTAELSFGERSAILVAAPVCEIVRSDNAGTGLGPDILGSTFDIDGVMQRARASSRATIAEVLLDQSVCAGIGNIHRCEALWHERVDPFAAVAALDDGTLARVVKQARDRLRRAAVADAFRPPIAVHGRAGRPCPSCGAPISVAHLGRPPRLLFWCRTCQDGTAAPLTPRAAPTG